LPYSGPDERDPGQIAAGSRQTRDEASAFRKRGPAEDDGNRRGRLLCRERRGGGGGANNVDVEFHERTGQPWQARGVTVRPAGFDREVPSLDVAQLAQPPSERLKFRGPGRRRSWREPADAPHPPRLLCFHIERRKSEAYSESDREPE
jgi:hypothetical protein